MLKWLLTLILLIVVLGLAQPLLARLGFGRLPGDLRLRHKGREHHFPITTTVLLSVILTLLLILLT